MTRIIILAAGEGTRLRPLTNKKPKCLVEIFGKTILQTQIDILKKNNIENIHIATGYQKNKINELGYLTHFNENFNTTNMVVSLFKSIEHINNISDEDLIISYGDIIYESIILEKLLSSSHDMSIIIDLDWKSLWELRFDDPLTDAETLILNNDSSIKEIGKKTTTYKDINGQYIGLIKIKKNFIKEIINFYKSKTKISPKNKFDKLYMTDFIQMLINDNTKIMSVPINGGWLEVDTLSDLKTYESLKVKKLLHRYYKL